jgi:hypothetical protein
MLLLHLLFRGKRNRRRRWSELGDYGTIRNSGWGRGGSATTASPQNAGALRHHLGRRSDNLGLAYLVCVEVHRDALDRLSRGEGILWHRYNGTAIYVVDIGDVDVSDIDIGDPRVSDIHLADVSL